MEKFIINLLDLKEKDINSIDSITRFNHSDFLISLKQCDHICPKCGSITHYVKDYKIRTLKHKILINFDSVIYYRQRRYICNHCKKSFIENSPFTGSRHSLTPATLINILNDLKPYNSTFSSVARKYNVSVSTVIDIFDKHVQIPRKKLTSVLCWDEFYFNRHAQKKYAFMIMDFSKKYIIDIVHSRWHSDLSDYFFNITLNERNNVDFIIIDMYSSYKSLINIFFKKAVICVDPFHAVKKVNDSLNSVRKRIMRTYSSDNARNSVEYRLLKSRYFILLKNKDELEDEKFKYDSILQCHTTELGILEKILKTNPILEEAYKIKEDYILFNNESEQTFQGTEKKKEELDSIISRMITSQIPEMIECAKTLKNWSEEIINSFHWIDGRRLSNGPIEGKNNYIKKIINNANGFNNFERARNKFMYSQNQYETYKISESKKEIKRKKGPRGKYKKGDK